MKRREFLRVVGAAGTAALLGRVSGCTASEKKTDSAKSATRMADIYPMRTLGKTGQRVSIVAFGGLSLAGVGQDEADRAIGEAFEKGINYFDVAPSYGDAELKMGPALKPYRDRVFLACKTAKRDRAGAQEELNRSLERLGTDHFDLYQLHHITDVEKDVRAALAKGGAMEAIIEAKKAGVIRYIGFSAHSKEAAMAAMKEFEFDTAMFPINFVCSFQNGFEKGILAEAKRQGLGIIALKASARQRWAENPDKSSCPRCWYEPIVERGLIEQALGWTYSQGAMVAIPPSDLELVKTAIDLAPRCKPPTSNEIEEMKKIAAGARPIFG